MQRWPAVPIAANAIARSARSRSADGATIAPLLPPSSSSARPNRAASRGATARPIAVEPVADTSGTRRSSTSAWPTAGPPMITSARCGGASANPAHARANSAWVASAVSGVFSDGFHTHGSPQISASAAFHAHTATGKLNAEMTPTTPSGCQVSIIRCSPRSLGRVRPPTWRASPTAKSQMSIISWTSPAPSLLILPASIVTSRARSSLAARSTSPNRRTSSPRRGAGTSRHAVNAAAARPIAAPTSAVSATWPSSSPVIGERAATPRSPSTAGSTPRRVRRWRVSATTEGRAMGQAVPPPP